MTDLKQLGKLDDLEDEVLVGVQLEAFGGRSALLFEAHVSLSGWVDAWEEVTEQVHEDLQVLSDDLGQVEISESSHEKIWLGELRLSSLELTGDDEHRLNSTETPIVMHLLG